MSRFVGVDVSKYNGYPDWLSAKKAGVQFAILRAVSGSRGGYIDPTFEYNYKKCKEVGIHVGIYIASYMNIDREITLTNQVIKGKQFEFPIYFDVEGFSVDGTGLNRNEITERTLKFCNYFENKGYYVGIYSSASFFDSVLIPSKISKFDRWVADWRKGRSYSMHQYTNRGQWKGIPNTGEGGVDTNYSYIDYPEIMKNHGLNGYTKPQPKSGGDNMKKKNIVIAYWSDGDLANAQALLNSLPGAALVRTKDASIYKEDYVIQVGGFDIKGSNRKVFGRNRVATLEEVTKVAKELNK